MSMHPSAMRSLYTQTVRFLFAFSAHKAHLNFAPTAAGLELPRAPFRSPTTSRCQRISFARSLSTVSGLCVNVKTTLSGNSIPASVKSHHRDDTSAWSAGRAQPQFSEEQVRSGFTASEAGPLGRLPVREVDYFISSASLALTAAPQMS